MFKIVNIILQERRQDHGSGTYKSPGHGETWSESRTSNFGRTCFIYSRTPCQPESRTEHVGDQPGGAAAEEFDKLPAANTGRPRLCATRPRDRAAHSWN